MLKFLTLAAVAGLFSGCIGVMDFSGDPNSGPFSGGSGPTRARVDNRLSGIVLSDGDTVSEVSLYGVRVDGVLFGVVDAGAITGYEELEDAAQTVSVTVDSAVATIPICGGVSGGYCTDVEVPLREIEPFNVTIQEGNDNTVTVDTRVIPIHDLIDDATSIRVKNELVNTTVRVSGVTHDVLGIDLYRLRVGNLSFGTLIAGATTSYKSTDLYGNVSVRMDSMVVAYRSCFGSSCDTLQTTVTNPSAVTVSVDRYVRNTVVFDKALAEQALAMAKLRVW